MAHTVYDEADRLLELVRPTRQIVTHHKDYKQPEIIERVPDLNPRKTDRKLRTQKVLRGQLYVVLNSAERVKIGASTDVTKRLQTYAIEAAHWDREIVSTYVTDYVNDVYRAEDDALGLMIKANTHQYRIGIEWFVEGDFNVAVACVKQAAWEHREV